MTEPPAHEPTLADLARSLPLGNLLTRGAQPHTSQRPEDVLQDVAEAIHRVLGYQRVYVRLRSPDTDELTACAFAGLPPAHVAKLAATPLAPALYQQQLQPRFRTGDSFRIPNGALLAGTFQEFDPDLRAAGAATLLVPLRSRSERLIGLIYACVLPDSPTVTPAAVRLLEAIARQAALAIEQARIATQTTRLLAKEQLLAELGREIGDTLDLVAILARTTARLEAAFQGGTIALLNEQDELEIVASIGPIDDAARAVRLKRGQGICGWVVQHGQPYLANDTESEMRVPPACRDVGTNALIRSYIAVPIRSAGQIIGTLSAEAPEANAFTFEDLDLLEAVAAQIGGPIAGATLYRRTRRLAEAVRRRNEQLLVLNTIARAAVATLDLDRMLSTVAAQLQQGFGYDHVEVYLVDETAGVYTLAAQAGPFAPNALGATQQVGIGLLGQASRAGRTLRVDDVRGEPEYLGRNDGETLAELCVPVMAGGRVLAILNLEARQVGAFTDEDVAVLETAADVLASAIEHARLYQRAQEAAVLEERSRLARDLHDSVTQQLFSMTLTAQAARAQLQKNPARAAQQLERLQETAQAALAEMRALIFQLRPPELSARGLVGALQQLATATSRRDGLPVSFEAHGEERHASGADQTIYRIVQESLSNIVRHAHATQAWVELWLEPARVRLLVRDNGQGFDPAAAPGATTQHLGLTSMRERAAESGGTLEVRSQMGAGTEVELVVERSPVEPRNRGTSEPLR